MSRTFGECADGQMTHAGAWHARQLGDRIQIHPGHGARAFFFLAALLWRRRSASANGRGVLFPMSFSLSAPGARFGMALQWALACAEDKTGVCVTVSLCLSVR